MLSVDNCKENPDSEGRKISFYSNRSSTVHPSAFAISSARPSAGSVGVLSILDTLCRDTPILSPSRSWVIPSSAMRARTLRANRCAAGSCSVFLGIVVQSSLWHLAVARAEEVVEGGVFVGLMMN